MKKVTMWLLSAFMLLLSSNAFSSVGSLEDGNAESIDTNINWSTNLDHSSDGSTGTVSVSNTPIFTGDVTFRSTLLTNGRAGGALSLASSSTSLAAANLAYSVIVKYVGSGVDTNPGSTLENGAPGQVITFIIGNLQSGASWLITPTTKTGFNTITMDTKGDLVTLLYVNDTVGWIIQANSGAVIAQS